LTNATKSKEIRSGKRLLIVAHGILSRLLFRTGVLSKGQVNVLPWSQPSQKGQIRPPVEYDPFKMAINGGPGMIVWDIMSKYQ
jgi:hypothetical protein